MKNDTMMIEKVQMREMLLKFIQTDTSQPRHSARSKKKVAIFFAKVFTKVRQVFILLLKIERTSVTALNLP